MARHRVWFSPNLAGWHYRRKVAKYTSLSQLTLTG